ncbi:probable Glycosyl transferase, group 1 [Psychrobacter arcticus 273-4]|uniref:Probable Glycosyl transferase, group 1 n=1 Tax=Psychrobacter arcticus (strain DSM 17307 / VKM B-2377 / 273-4) TaxID=259536 RepID=Q4FTY5_PSYA2|nr:glycosyltransferase [Psychrobacter arcticus]AAZ18523.1 probable Glycosyl transferase, group 1 [Psychrobacter arcticus 273-4]
MKKIAIFLPDLRAGGAEKVALLLSNEFVQKGCAVDVILCTAHGEFLSELDTRINVVDLKSPRLRNAFFPLLRYLKAERPDVLLALMWPLTLLAVTAFKFAKLPGRVVVSDHTTFSQAPLLKKKSTRIFFKLSLPMVYSFANARLAVSEGVANDLATLGNIKRSSITVLHNPVSSDTMRFTKEQNEESWQGFSGKKIVAVGALKWEKDYPTLLKAFALLLKKENAYLSIVGQGTLLSELEAIAEQLGIRKQVNFAGFSTMPSAWMASADLLVLSSSCEGFGNVIVESLDVGTAVVSTDCKSGPREILCDGKYGKLVPVGDVDALAQAMVESLNEQHDMDALKLRAAKFSVDKIAKQYLEVFR